jgi:hypothetical protein
LTSPAFFDASLANCAPAALASPTFCCAASLTSSAFFKAPFAN